MMTLGLLHDVLSELLDSLSWSRDTITADSQNPCLSDRMSVRESILAWFASELPGKSVFAKQAPQAWQSP